MKAIRGLNISTSSQLFSRQTKTEALLGVKNVIRKLMTKPSSIIQFQVCLNYSNGAWVMSQSQQYFPSQKTDVKLNFIVDRSWQEIQSSLFILNVLWSNNVPLELLRVPPRLLALNIQPQASRCQRPLTTLSWLHRSWLSLSQSPSQEPQTLGRELLTFLCHSSQTLRFDNWKVERLSYKAGS